MYRIGYLKIFIYLIFLLFIIPGCKETSENNVKVIPTPVSMSEFPTSKPLPTETPSLNSSVIPTELPTIQVNFPPTATTVPVTQTPLSEPPYIFVKKWGSKGNGDGQFECISGIAVDIGGNVYVSDFANKSIQKFTSNGKLIFRWDPESEPEKQFGKPAAITVDVNENIYIVSGNIIHIFNSEGTYSQIKGNDYRTYKSVVMDSSGNIYALSRDTIDKYTSEGKFIKKWEVYHFPDQPPLPPNETVENMTIDFNNNIFAINIFRPFIDYTQGKNLVSSYSSLYKYNSNGKLITSYSIGGPGSKIGDIAIDQEDNIFLSDYNNNCIWKLDSKGNVITKWGSKGEGDGEFKDLFGDIAVDLEGNVYVADISNHRIQKFSPNPDYKSE